MEKVAPGQKHGGALLVGVDSLEETAASASEKAYRIISPKGLV